MEPFQSIPGYAYGADADSSDPESSPLDPPMPLPQASPPIMAPGAQPLPIPAPLPVAPAAAPSARRRAGAAVVLAGVGVGTGALVGGAWGAGSGLLFAGVAMNALRARRLWASPDPADRGEAIKTTAMLVIGLAGAGYLGYRAHQAR